MTSRAGHVYAMVNPSIPGKVKVGMTTRDPATRARELHTTGTPLPFEVVGAWPVSDVVAAETAAHQVLSSFRVSGDREWFRIEPAQAVALIEARLLPAPDAVRRRPSVVRIVRGIVEAFGWLTLGLLAIIVGLGV